MKMSKYIIYSTYCAAIVAIIGLSSCNKTVFYSAGNLSFSADTLVFDTVFTTVGSTTLQLKIYNNDNKTLTINQIELMGGASSVYRINVDGVMGTNFANIEFKHHLGFFITLFKLSKWRKYVFHVSNLLLQEV